MARRQVLSGTGDAQTQVIIEEGPGVIGNGLPILEEGVPVGPAQKLNFTGTGVTATVDGGDPNQINVDIPPGAGGVATVTAGDGLINSGTAINPIIDAVANADGSITVNPNDIQVGVLATDAQHGVRGGGTQHAVATVADAGFMSAADKTKLDGIATGATNTPLSAAPPVDVTKAAAAVGVSTDAARADHKHDITTASAVEITDSTNTEGVATTLARSDHNHAHGNRGGGTLHPAVTTTVNGFMSSTDKTKLNNLVADWALGTTRFYAVDYDAGSDSNVGFSDVSMAAAGAVAKKTIEGLAAIFPKFGQGRKVVIAIKARAGGAVYRNAADTADAELDWARGVYGYQNIVCRATGTVATAGAVAFANDAADKVALGAQIVPGTNAPGYNPTGVPTVSVFTCTLAGGGAPGLAAEPALIGKRVRFDSATTTVALRNAVAMIHENTTDTITVSNNLPATPVASDVFYIEEPATAFDRLVVSACDNGTNALQPSFLTNGLKFVGFRFPNTGGTHVAISAMGVGRFVLSFCDVASPGFAAARIFNGRDLALQRSYVDETDTTITTGVALRVVGWLTTSQMNSIFSDALAIASGRWQLLNTGPGPFNVGGGSYYGLGILTQNCKGSGPTNNTIGGNNLGNLASSTVRRLRTNGGFATDCISFTNTDFFLRGVDMRNAGALALITVRGVGINGSINDAVGTTGNTGAGLDLTLARDARIVMGQLNANTFAGAAGRVIEGAGPVGYDHVDYALTTLRDARENKIQGANSTELGPTSFATNDGTGTILKYKICRATGSALVRHAQADTAANAAGVVGVSQSNFSAVPVQNTMLAEGGAVWVQFDAAPSAGAIAYLSTATPGNAQVAVPAVAGTNQKLRLGRVLRVSGTLGQVAWSPEVLSVLADGAA